MTIEPKNYIEWFALNDLIPWGVPADDGNYFAVCSPEQYDDICFPDRKIRRLIEKLREDCKRLVNVRSIYG